MRHPTEGTLRRLLDEPAGVADSDRLHVADCRQCLDLLATFQRDASLVGAALAVEAPAHLDEAAAWARLSTTRPTRSAAPDRPGRARALLHRPAVAGLAVAVVLTGAGTAAANDWLQIFRTEQVAPVRITAADLVALPDLSAYGELDATGRPNLHEVADADAA